MSKPLARHLSINPDTVTSVAVVDTGAVIEEIVAAAVAITEEAIATTATTEETIAVTE